MTVHKPWRTEIGAAVGLIVGGLLWWEAFEPGLGLFQNAQRVVFSVVAGIAAVVVRNWCKQVGPFDPDVQESNKRGRP